MLMSNLAPTPLFQRVWRGSMAAMLMAVLAACSSNPVPPLQWVALPPLTSSISTPASIQSANKEAVWQLMLPVTLPSYLDRDAVLMRDGSSSLLPIAGARWAEPLRDGVPRILRQDLGTLFGDAQVWAAPLPSGLTPTRQLRVDITSLEANPQKVTLQARWLITDPQGIRAPQVVTQNFEQALSVQGSRADAIGMGYRQILWQLAQAIHRSSVSPS